MMNEKRFYKDMLNIVDVLTNKAYTFEFEKELFPYGYYMDLQAS